MFRQRVSLEDVLQFLRGSSMVPSGLGAMLDRLRDGVSGGTVAPSEIVERLEARMLDNGALVRCLSELAKRNKLRNPWLTSLIALAHRTGSNEGALAIAILKAYQPWGTTSPERALAEVYVWKRSFLGDDSETRADALAQLFREGKFGDWRGDANRLYGDALEAVREWVHMWRGIGLNEMEERCARVDAGSA